MAILDSGDRTEYASGAVRDMKEGKGRCDLLPLKEVGEFLDWVRRGDMKHSGTALDQFAIFVEDAKKGEINKEFLYSALYRFSGVNNWDAPTMLIELSKHFEEGAIKYKERNWELGIEAHSFVDSSIRHYLKWLRGDDDERHDRAVCWNWICLLWTLRNKPECNDLVGTKSDADNIGNDSPAVEPIPEEEQMSPEAMANVFSMWNSLFTHNPFPVSNMGDFPIGKETEK